MTTTRTDREPVRSAARPNDMPRTSTALLTVLLVPALLSGCGLMAADQTTTSTSANSSADPAPEAPATTSAAPSSSGWSRLPDPPLSPRQGPVGAYLDDHVIFVGGDTGTPCPPTADCAGPPEYARDGASYDFDTQRWTPIADAPVGVYGHAIPAVVDGRLYLLIEGDLLSYDPTKDTWSTETVPAKHPEWYSPVADGNRVVLVSGSDEQFPQPDRAFDVRTGRWSNLPEDPLGTSFDRALTSTSGGLVLTAKAIDQNGQPADPALVQAALLPPGSLRWQPLPASDQLGGGRWVWTGLRLVDPSPGGADGGEVNNYGRVIPYGGRLDLVAQEWSNLPNAPKEFTGGWPVEALDGPLMAVEGWLYDDKRGTWTRLAAPAEAPPQPGSAAWAGDTLVVYGGADWEGAQEPSEWTAENVYSPQAWAYRAP